MSNLYGLRIFKMRAYQASWLNN